MRRVEDITEALWGTRVSSGTVSRLNQKIYRHIEAWRNRAIEGEFPYVLPRRRGAQAQLGRRSTQCLGAGGDRRRNRWIPADPGRRRGREGGSGGLARLPAPPQGSRPPGVQLIISDACRGLVEAAAELFPDAQWQRCVVHFYRNVFSNAPNNKVAEVARMLKAIHAQEDRGIGAGPRRTRSSPSSGDEAQRGRRIWLKPRPRDADLLWVSVAITGGRSKPIIRSSASSARFAGARASSAHSRTGTQR